ncbi:MAG: YnbE family lipoprotein [Rhodospirillaceae bacterium]
MKRTGLVLDRKKTALRAKAIALGAMVTALGACSPTVRLEVPDKPIVINLNVKIEQEVRVKLEKGVEEAMLKNPKIF